MHVFTNKINKLKYIHFRLINFGLMDLVKYILFLILDNLLWLFLLPFGIIIHCTNYRRVNVNVSAIGHLASEIDAVLKEKYIFNIRYNYFICVNPSNVANLSLLYFWGRYIHIIDNNITSYLLRCSTLRWFGLKDVSHFVQGSMSSVAYYDINKMWRGRAPLLSVEPNSRTQLVGLLKSLGLAENSWYVCFHSRNNSYRDDVEFAHNHRNCDLSLMKGAMQYVIERGGTCILMQAFGDHDEFCVPGIINYYHSPFKSEQNDVLLCAGARLFVGCSSGLFLVSSVFGVPVALTNMCPISHFPFSERDFSIPKLLYSKDKMKFLNLDEIRYYNITDERFAFAYAAHNIEIRQNSPDEIMYLVIEALSETTKYFSQNHLTKIYLSHLSMNDYGKNASCNISEYFLKKNRFLIEFAPEKICLSN